MSIFEDLPPEEVLLKEYINPYAEPPLLVNAHFHTPYSFSAFEQMNDIFLQAAEERIKVLGMTDFSTFEGFDEFNRLAIEHRIFPLFNIEFMGLMEQARDRGVRINDPNNPGRVYFCGKGLSFPVILKEEHRSTMEGITENSMQQTRRMVELLNKHLKSLKAKFLLDFEDIQANYTKGLVRERHIAKALRISIGKHYRQEKDKNKFLNDLYGNRESKVQSDRAGELDNEIRSMLLKKGGVAFVEEDASAFPSLEKIKEIILSARGIPCYPVLLDDAEGNFTDFEQDFEGLLKELTKKRIYAVELIPGRNDFSVVKRFAAIFNEKGFLITFGTEHNTPDPAPLTVSCRGNVPLDEDLLATNYQSACVIAAHQYRVARGKAGYLTPDGFPRLEKQDDFIALGNAVIRKFIHA